MREVPPVKPHLLVAANDAAFKVSDVPTLQALVNLLNNARRDRCDDCYGSGMDAANCFCRSCGGYGYQLAR